MASERNRGRRRGRFNPAVPGQRRNNRNTTTTTFTNNNNVNQTTGQDTDS